MSKTYVSRALQRPVWEDANHLCEYCLIHDIDSVTEGHIDHIVSEKHGGETNAGNLAYACLFCNRAKGSDIGSLDWNTNEFVRFYNPRVDRWTEHFATDSIRIEPRSAIGRVTARILNFNTPERLMERQDLYEVGRYPPQEAEAVLENKKG